MKIKLTKPARSPIERATASRPRNGVSCRKFIFAEIRKHLRRRLRSPTSRRRPVATSGMSYACPYTSLGRWRWSCSWCWGPVLGKPLSWADAAGRSPPRATSPSASRRFRWFRKPHRQVCKRKRQLDQFRIFRTEFKSIFGETLQNIPSPLLKLSSQKRSQVPVLMMII